MKKTSFIVYFLALFISCNESQVEELKTQNNKQLSVIEIITEGMEFQMPDTINSGWNVWRYKNLSTQPHFILIDKHPDSITVKEFKEQLLPPFGEGIAMINEGKMEEAMKAFGNIPAWFSGTWWPGGVGLISPGQNAETILKLDPGYYIIECYVKMNTGMFHTNMGMYKPLIVSDEKSNMEEPTADIVVDISSKNGIQFTPPNKSGTYTFLVNYLDQIKHEHFQGHDINLVKINDTTKIGSIEAWMNWMDPKGLIDPMPQGFTFLGGVNDMPAGEKGYFTATLQPGEYALISEVPNASSKGMLKRFEVR
ncbi:MAG: hypothetical protein ACR2KB_10095 [Chitinophagaceae bacterium]